MLKLDEGDHKAVTDAVREAEARTDAEIVTVVAASSDSYHDVGLHYAVLAMLLVPAVWAVLPQDVVDWALALVLGWNGVLTRGALMALIFVKLTAVFLVVRYALAYMPLRIALTPGATKSRRVRRRALQYFKLAAERRTHGRTGVLLYLSLLEHRAEIVVDEAVLDKVPPEAWGDAMVALVDEVKAGRPGEGMGKAVRMMGDLLSVHLPKSDVDRNELPDRLVEL